MKWQFVGHTPFPNYFFSLLNQQVGWYTRPVWSNRHVCWWKSQCFAGWAAMSVAQIPMVGWILLVGLINFGCNPIPLGIWGVHPNHRGNPKGGCDPHNLGFIQPRYFMWLSHIFHPLDPIFTFLPQKSCQKLPLRPETPRRVARGDLASAARQTEGPPSRRDDWGLPKLGQVQHGLEWEYMGIYIYIYKYIYI